MPQARKTRSPSNPVLITTIPPAVCVEPFSVDRIPIATRTTNTEEAELKNVSSSLLLIGYPRKDQPEKGLPFRYTDYLELVDWSHPE